MKTVWTNGCFDVLHRGHIEMLAYAKSLGDRLCVGIDSDTKVSNDKGIYRPYNNQIDRKFMLESIRYVDEVVIFNTPQELEECVKKISPEYLVVGSDWKGKDVVGAKYTQEVKFFDRVGNYSTTAILDKV